MLARLLGSAVLVATLGACGDRTGLLLDPIGQGEATTSQSGSTSTSAELSTRVSATTGPSSSASFTLATTVFSTIETTTIPTTTTSSTAHGLVTFASGPDWESSIDFAPIVGQLTATPLKRLGPAQTVCVEAQNPLNCPPNSVIYGSPSTPWSGGRALPNAFWIWENGVAPSQPGDLQAALFEKSFNLGTNPSGSIQIAVDDLAEVFVNGVLVGSTGSVTNYATASNGQTRAATIDLSLALVTGTNVIDVAVQNGPTSFGTGCPAQGCAYSQNPAGVVFAGTLSW